MISLYIVGQQLYADNNPKIKNIRNMKNLKILSCAGNCGIGDADMKDLYLIKLDARYNPKITIKNFEIIQI